MPSATSPTAPLRRRPSALYFLDRLFVLAADGPRTVRFRLPIVVRDKQLGRAWLRPTTRSATPSSMAQPPFTCAMSSLSELMRRHHRRALGDHCRTLSPGQATMCELKSMFVVSNHAPHNSFRLPLKDMLDDAALMKAALVVVENFRSYYTTLMEFRRGSRRRTACGHCWASKAIGATSSKHLRSASKMPRFGSPISLPKMQASPTASAILWRWSFVGRLGRVPGG